jgi:flagellar basal-body rod protein FlgF
MIDIFSKSKLAVQKPNVILLSLQRVQEDELHTASVNLASSAEPGYKQLIQKSEETKYHTKDKKKVSYVKSNGLARNHSDGSINMTRNPLDLALSGRGYMMVQTPEGMRYTRNGRFTMDTSGRLVTPAGHPVLDQNGSEIQIPKNVESFSVSSSGYISINGRGVGQLGIMTFENEDAMRQEGNSLFSTSEQGVQATNTSVTQGGFEESNVSPMEISIQLINILHRYEEAQKLIQNYEDLIKQTTNASAKNA